MAVFPVQPGSPDYSSTSTNAYIPAIYSALLVKKFYPETVFSKISNTDYEGDIKTHGDTVYIRTRPTIETFKYQKGMVLPVQNPESPYLTLKIDQGEGFSFALDKVDEFQSDIKLMNEWADDASKQMAQVLDRNVLISMAVAGAVAGGQAASTVIGYAGANTSLQSNVTIGSATVPGAIVKGAYTAKGTLIGDGTGTGVAGLATSNTAAQMDTGDKITARLLKMARYLNENNAPTEGRFAILPMWTQEKLLSMTSNNFGLAYATGQNSAGLLSGQVPKLAGFEIIFSNNLPLTSEDTNGTKDNTCIIFGSNYATTFATQITESRIIDNPFAFGKMMQGLQVYGFNVVKAPLVGFDFWKSVA
jgi:hypothetical protein